ncbi:MAG: hypothetical protein EZS28_000119 [Streblomastix strix]|uniref:Integrase catalytic domain-containing protein n=1 Tax=Streblomastix strix TaxID=222440 RepID=A0A5J4XBZ8_9EUKA|nr:MAG: hypothetical protein EZS28_000119 [Streblomastix strix]
MNALQKLVKNNHFTNIRGDDEKGFSGNILKTFSQENNFTSFFTDSKFTNRSRVVDSVFMTIRNGFGNDSEKFADNDLMQQMVQMYNQIPHSAYDNKYYPKQANDNDDIEGQYKRQQKNKLFDIKIQQQNKGLLSFQPGIILLIHLDYTKTGDSFVMQRRNFNELAEFIKQSNGNVMVKLLKSQSDLKIVELLEQYCKLVAKDICLLDTKYKDYFKL